MKPKFDLPYGRGGRNNPRKKKEEVEITQKNYVHIIAQFYI
jgi:hypothetical protein